jgi:hypothetical protein
MNTNYTIPLFKIHTLGVGLQVIIKNPDTYASRQKFSVNTSPRNIVNLYILYVGATYVIHMYTTISYCYILDMHIMSYNN